MKYLLIENQGECPLEAFTMLGVSTSRGEKDSIGQFGTGAKHGVLTLLRASQQPVIFCGSTKVEIYTETQIVSNKAFERVYFKVTKKDSEPVVEKTSMTLSFGELDWSNEINMALREFISNALDQVDQDWNRIKLSVSEECKPRPFWTRVYVPLVPEVKKYLGEIEWRFLHPNGRHKEKVLRKPQMSTLKLYRKGVFVRNPSNKEPSLFDYNFGDDIPIDESRNMDDYRACCFAASILCDDTEATALVLKKIQACDSGFAESRFSSWYLNSALLRDAWNLACEKYWMIDPQKAVFCTAVYEANAIARSSEYRPVLFNPNASHSWVSALKDSRILQAKDILSKADRQGFSTFEASKELVEAFNRVWFQLNEFKLTRGKVKPKVKEYYSTVDKTDGSKILGFYDETQKTVFIHTDHKMSTRVIVEEIGHYISEHTDETRGFEDWLFSVIVKLLD